jgi:hypothetical protein
MATIPTHIATKKQHFLLPKDSRHQKKLLTPPKNTFRHQKTPPATKKTPPATKRHLSPPKDSSRHQKKNLPPPKDSSRHQKTRPATKKTPPATKKHLSRHHFYGSERVSYAYCHQEATSPATKKRVAYA